MNFAHRGATPWIERGTAGRGINQMLFELNEAYSEIGQHASTGLDEHDAHDDILNILEGKGLHIFFQRDKDWHCRAGR